MASVRLKIDLNYEQRKFLSYIASFHDLTLSGIERARIANSLRDTHYTDGGARQKTFNTFRLRYGKLYIKFLGKTYKFYKNKSKKIRTSQNYFVH